MKRKTPVPVDGQAETSVDPFLSALVELGRTLQQLGPQALAAYEPDVNSILRSRSRDIQHIERTLDGLRGFCFDAGALLLFKKLCRYYYDIDPGATALYVHDYRKMWDSEEEADSDD